MIGKKFGKQIVIGESDERSHGNIVYIVRCECGNIRKIRKGNLVNKKVLSCRKCRPHTPVKYPGNSGSKPSYVYRLWSDIKSRCYNKNHKRYLSYGGRGINVFQEWKDDFGIFLNYIETKLGTRPKGCSLDRIDNNGNYEPDNIRWASKIEQARNTRTVYKVVRYKYSECKIYPCLASVKDDGFSPQTVWKIISGRKNCKHKGFNWKRG